MIPGYTISNPNQNNNNWNEGSPFPNAKKKINTNWAVGSFGWDAWVDPPYHTYSPDFAVLIFLYQWKTS